MMTDSIVQMVLPVLLQFFGKTTEGASKKIGEKLGEKVYGTLMKHFGEKDAYARQTLARLKEKPDSVPRQKAFQAVLQEQLEKDPVLAAMISEMLSLTTSSHKTPIVVAQKAENVKGNVTQDVRIGDAKYEQT